MAWTWTYQNRDGQDIEPDGEALGVGGTGGSFPDQSEAESWLGETWRALAEGGIASVSLHEEGRFVYGPMPLAGAG